MILPAEFVVAGSCPSGETFFRLVGYSFQATPFLSSISTAFADCFSMKRLTILAFVLLWGPTLFAADSFVFHHENVLGTHLELKIRASSVETARQAENRVLSEIDRLSTIYSTYRPDSELSRWMVSSQPEARLSPELFELFEQSRSVWLATRGAFDPRVADACRLWKRAASENRIPTDKELSSVIPSSISLGWTFAPERQSVWRLSKEGLTFDGIAKGMIVDRCVAAAIEVPGVEGVLVNIGGDLRIEGSLTDNVTISSPHSPSASLERLHLQQKAIATSGNYYRGVEAGGKWRSHIIDPRTSMPVELIVSASVIADSAATADAYATAFSVLSPEQSLEICNRSSDLACLLVTSDGAQHRSLRWPSHGNDGLLAVDCLTADEKSAQDAGQLWNPKPELKIEFEINRADGNRYRRPYVAVWIEDKDQYPVRTLTLWMQTDGPGPRWHRDLRRWYKQDALRKVIDETNLIGTISAATKPPGQYKVVWDGKDDGGKLVKKGKYTLYLEAAREHGTYQLMSKEIEIGDKESKGDLGQNAEFKSARFEYMPTGARK